MRLGGPGATSASRDQQAAEELLDAIQRVYDDANMFERAELLGVLERQATFAEAPPNVRKMLEQIVSDLGIGDS